MTKMFNNHSEISR